MFGFGKNKKDKPAPTGGGLKLATDDRERFVSTAASDRLARKVVKIANGVAGAGNLPAGHQFSVEVPGSHGDVHFAELTLSLMGTHSSPGVTFVVMYDNLVIFEA